MGGKIVVKLTSDAAAWRRFTVRRVIPGYEILGVAYHGCAVGALARCERSGGFYQINGDWFRELGTARVERAIAVAKFEQMRDKEARRRDESDRAWRQHRSRQRDQLQIYR